MSKEKLATSTEVLPITTERAGEEAFERILLEAATTPSMSIVAARAGIPYKTLRYWIRLGEQGDPRFAAFVKELHRLRAPYEEKLLEQLEKLIMSDDPKVANAKLKAITWQLEKLWPTQYGEQIYVQTMIERQAEGYDLSVLPQEEMRQFMKMLKLVKMNHDGADKEQVQRYLTKITKGAGGESP